MNPNEAAKRNVFVVDEDSGIRDTLTVLVEQMHCWVWTFATTAKFLAFYRPELRGCLIHDVNSPRAASLQLPEQLLEQGMRLPVIFISGLADVRLAVAAMKSGGYDFFEKPLDLAPLRISIEQSLVVGEQQRKQDAAYDEIGRRIARLTSRESETMQLVLAGESNKSMAAALFISERAVEMRRASILRKLTVSSTAELLELTITHRVLSQLRGSENAELVTSDSLA